MLTLNMINWSTTMWGSPMVLDFAKVAGVGCLALGPPSILSMMLWEVSSEWSRLAMPANLRLKTWAPEKNSSASETFRCRKKDDEISKKKIEIAIFKNYFETSLTIVNRFATKS